MQCAPSSPTNATVKALSTEPRSLRGAPQVRGCHDHVRRRRAESCRGKADSPDAVSLTPPVTCRRRVAKAAEAILALGLQVAMAHLTFTKGDHSVTVPNGIQVQFGWICEKSSEVVSIGARKKGVLNPGQRQ